MIVERLELVDFRNYAAAAFDLTAGTTVVVGDNGQGKTNLAEALGLPRHACRASAARRTRRSSASAPTSAIVRATLRDDDGQSSLIEAELLATGRSRVQVNRQRLPAPATCSAWSA